MIGNKITSVVHIHIPRTAGSSLQAHLTRVLRNAGVTFTSEHCFWGDYPPAPDRLFFVVLRDPIDRVLSLYNYIRATPEHSKHALCMSRPLWRVLLTNQDSQFANAHARHLIGRRAAGVVIGKQDIKAAADVLRRPDVIWTTSDAIDSGLAELSRRVGVAIPPMAEYRNRSIAEEASRFTRAVAKATNLWDCEFYRIAKLRGLRRRAGMLASFPMRYTHWLSIWLTHFHPLRPRPAKKRGGLIRIVDGVVYSGDART
jgi:hypothetical protein